MWGEDEHPKWVGVFGPQKGYIIQLTPPKTNSKSPGNGWLEDRPFLLERPIFCDVSCREGRTWKIWRFPSLKSEISVFVFVGCIYIYIYIVLLTSHVHDGNHQHPKHQGNFFPKVSGACPKALALVVIKT